MKRLFRVLGILIALFLVAAGITSVAARFHDGPIFAFAGGPLEAGEWVDLSWHDATFLADVSEIEFQLVEPPRSRITWVVVHERAAYIPCGMPNSMLKQWPHEAVADGRAVIRTGGKLHRRQLVKIDDPALEAVLRTSLGEKYGVEDYSGEVWFFRLDPRREG